MTIHISDKDALRVLDALTLAEGRELDEAMHYTEWAERYKERSYDEADRDRMLLAAADCRRRAAEYRQAYEAVYKEVLGA